MATAGPHARTSSTEGFRNCMRVGIERMDVAYHGTYEDDRQTSVHIPILQSIMGPAMSVHHTHTVSRPFMVHMAGSMGAGKSHVINILSQMDEDLAMAAYIDPDRIKTLLPENKQFILEDPKTASTRLHPESTYLSELAMWMCLSLGVDMIIDGTLKDHTWAAHMFECVRRDFPHFSIKIIHVRAQKETIMARVHQRTQQTQRHVPPHILEESIAKADSSVQHLRETCPLIDAIYVIDNDISDTECAWMLPRMRPRT